MKLYYFETPNSRNVCAVAKHLQLPVEMIHVDLSKGEHKTPDMMALNPNGKLPVLVDDDIVIWESRAIMFYLARKADSSLWPSDAAEQADVMKWMTWDTAHFTRHASTLLFENFIKAVFGMGDPDEGAIEEGTRFFHQFAGVLNEHLTGRSFVSGDQLTLADFSISAILSMSEQGKYPLEDYAQINRWFDEVMAVPALKDPWPAKA